MDTRPKGHSAATSCGKQVKCMSFMRTTGMTLHYPSRAGRNRVLVVELPSSLQQGLIEIRTAQPVLCFVCDEVAVLMDKMSTPVSADTGDSDLADLTEEGSIRMRRADLQSVEAAACVAAHAGTIALNHMYVELLNACEFGDVAEVQRVDPAE